MQQLIQQLIWQAIQLTMGVVELSYCPKQPLPIHMFNCQSNQITTKQTLPQLPPILQLRIQVWRQIQHRPVQSTSAWSVSREIVSVLNVNRPTSYIWASAMTPSLIGLSSKLKCMVRLSDTLYIFTVFYSISTASHIKLSSYLSASTIYEVPPWTHLSGRWSTPSHIDTGTVTYIGLTHFGSIRIFPWTF